MTSLVFVLIIAIATNVVAYTEEENFDYINQILAKLNQKKECQLPTYEEIDELNASFKELEKKYNNVEKLDSILNDDQKLVRKTLLDQWESFQKRMTSGIVIRTAKKRSFLCKIEEYQLAKYGFSICIETFDASKKGSDKIFEKNPIVRYVKHTDTNEVVNFDETAEEIDMPITNNDADVVKTPNRENLSEEEKEEESYDPLAEVPAPPASDQEVVESDVEPPNKEEEQIMAEQVSGATTTTTTTTTPLPTLERPDLPETTPPYSVESLKSPLDVQIDSPAESSNKAEIDALFRDQYSLPMVETPPEPPKQVDEQYTEDGAELVDELEDERDLARLDRVEPTDWDFDHIYGEFLWPDEHPYDNVCNFDKSIEVRWLKFLKEPFDYTEEEDDIDNHRQEPARPELLPQQQQPPLKSIPQLQPQNQPNPQPQPQPRPQRQPRQKQQEMGKLRMRKKEFLKSVNLSKRMYETDSNLGMIDEPNADIMPDKPEQEDDMFMDHQEEPIRSDRWKTLADNNFCKFSYNRDYISNTRPVKAVKGFLSGNSKKKLLMS